MTVIDVHTHMMSQDWLNMLAQYGGSKYVLKKTKAGQDSIFMHGAPFVTLLQEMFDFDLRIKNMDKAGVDVAVVSLTCPSAFFGNQEQSLAAAVSINDTMMEQQSRYPDRIRWFATLPWQYPEVAASELSRAVKNGAVGVFVSANIDECSLTDERFAPVWQAIDQLGLPVLVHPTAPQGVDKLQMHEYGLIPPIGFMFDTTLAISRMIFDGFFDRYLNLKIIAAHGGATLPYLAGRLDRCFDKIPACAEVITQPPSQYLREKIYYDAVVYDQDALDLLLKSAGGPDRVMFGSDYPHNIGDMEGCLARVNALDPSVSKIIKSDAAERLFKLQTVPREYGSMPVQTGGEAVIETLIANNIDTVFGLPGAQLDPIFAALHDRQDKIKIYHSRHEQGCAYMAYGYAASTNKTGVCFIVPGPGLLNAGAAMVTAYACNSPVLYFSGQLRAGMIDKGWGALHEIKDQFGLAGHLVKWTDHIAHAGQAPGRINAALSEIRRGRSRPVYLESPFDVLKEEGAVAIPSAANTDHKNPELDSDQTNAIAKQLAGASNPLIIAGGGAMDAGSEILALAEKINAPIVLTQNGLGAIDSRNARVFTQAGGYALWKDADIVLAFGTRLFPAATAYGHKGLNIVKVDIDPKELSRLPVPMTGVVADAADAAVELSRAVEDHLSAALPDRSNWIDGARKQLDEELRKIEPQRELLGIIREEITEDGIFVSDLTQLYFASQDAFPVYSPRSYIQPSYQGTLGHAVGTALGVKVGNPDRPVICVAGDGGFMFTVQELATAAKYNIGVIFLVMNDGAFGNVKRILNEHYGGREICADLHNPDFVKLADSFGIDGRRVESPASLREAIRHGVASNAPMLIEYMAPEFPSPWHLLQRKPVRQV